MSLRDLKRQLKSQRRQKARVVDGGEKPVRPQAGSSAVATNAFVREAGPDLSLSADEIERLDSLVAEGAPHIEALRALDTLQLRSVLHDGSTLVRAQVGSGKTTVLIQKILHLVVQGVDPSRILVFTFTRKAAREIDERLLEAFERHGMETHSLPVSGTFHSLAQRLLRREVETIDCGRSSSFEVLDETSRSEILVELVEQKKFVIRYAKKLQRRLELLKAGQPLFGNMKKEDDLPLLVQAYEEKKRELNVFDFDDLITLGSEAAKSVEDSERPLWMAVDELQDTDAEQLALLRAWRGEESKLFAVGDPDQVIYSWRGSGASLFDELKESFSCSEFELAVNYRSMANIVDAARFILGLSRQGSCLVATREEGDLVSIEEHYDQVAEARYIAQCLEDASKDESVAVLVRTRRQLDSLREQLVAAGVDVTLREKSTVGQSLRQFCIDYFRWLAAPANASLLQAWGRHEEFGFHETTAGWRETELAQIVSQWQKRGAMDGVQKLLEKSGIVRFLLPLSSRAASLTERLRFWLRDLETKENPQVLEQAVTLLTAVRGVDQIFVEGAGVSLLTMHASKGLEFDRVFLSGINRGLMPLSSSWSDDEKEAEERRLMFVAMTRARNFLSIGWTRQPSMRQVMPEPSPYLELIPEELVVRGSVVEEAPQAESSYGPGVSVRHKRYGEGVVVALENGLVSCLFEKHGQKSFPEGMCPLTLV